MDWFACTVLLPLTPTIPTKDPSTLQRGQNPYLKEGRLKGECICQWLLPLLPLVREKEAAGCLLIFFHFEAVFIFVCLGCLPGKQKWLTYPGWPGLAVNMRSPRVLDGDHPVGPLTKGLG